MNLQVWIPIAVFLLVSLCLTPLVDWLQSRYPRDRRLWPRPLPHPFRQHPRP